MRVQNTGETNQKPIAEGNPTYTSFLISQIDRTIEKLRPVLIDAAYTAAFGSAIGTLAEVVAEAVPLGEVRTVGAIAAAGAGIIAGIVATAEARVETGTEIAKAAVVLTGLLGATIAGVARGGEAEGLLVGGLLAGAGVVGAVAGRGISWILNRIEVEKIDQENIGWGVEIGSIAGMAVAIRWPIFPTMLEPISPTIIAVGSITAGILALARS